MLGRRCRLGMRARAREPKTSGDRTNYETKGCIRPAEVMPWRRLTEVMAGLLGVELAWPRLRIAQAPALQLVMAQVKSVSP